MIHSNKKSRPRQRDDTYGSSPSIADRADRSTSCSRASELDLMENPPQIPPPPEREHARRIVESWRGMPRENWPASIRMIADALDLLAGIGDVERWIMLRRHVKSHQKQHSRQVPQYVKMLDGLLRPLGPGEVRG